MYSNRLRGYDRGIEEIELIKLGRRRAPAAADDLLAQMLQQDTTMRITATQALEHHDLLTEP